MSSIIKVPQFWKTVQRVQPVYNGGIDGVVILPVVRIDRGEVSPRIGPRASRSGLPLLPNPFEKIMREIRRGALDATDGKNICELWNGGTVSALDATGNQSGALAGQGRRLRPAGDDDGGDAPACAGAVADGPDRSVEPLHPARRPAGAGALFQSQPGRDAPRATFPRFTPRRSLLRHGAFYSLRQKGGS